MAYGSTYDTTIYDQPSFGGTAKPLYHPPGDTTTTPPDTPTTPPVTTTPPDTGGGVTIPKVPPVFIGTDTLPFEPPKGATTTNPLVKPTLNFKDAASVDAYLAWAAQQPGVNPSVKNDPGYWRQKLLSGELGTDEAYVLQRMMQAEGAPAGAPGTGGFDLSGFNIGGLFDDPATKQFMDLLMARMGQLSQPINDPNAALVTQTLTDMIAHLNKTQNTTLPPLTAPPPVKDVPDMSAQFAALLKAIQDNTASTTGPTAKYQGILDDLVTQLQKPAYSDDQLAQLKTAAVDTLNHEHQTALDNKTRAMAMSGIPPSSGIAQEALKHVDEQYQTLKAQSLQAQNTEEIKQINDRRQQLMAAASSSLTAAQQQAKNEQDALVAQMNLLMNQRTQDISVRGQDLTAQQNAFQAALDQRNQDILMRGQDIQGTTAQATLASLLNQLGKDQRTETNANLDQILKLAGIPIDLTSQRLSQALQVLGLGSGTTSPTSLLSGLSAIANQSTLSNTAGNAAKTDWGKIFGDIFANWGK